MHFLFSLLQAVSAGLTEYWKKWSTSSMDMCKVDQMKSKEKAKPIKLIELSSAFLVLGIGIVMSSTVFLLERLLGSFTSR